MSNYDNKFYENQKGNSYRSAKLILPIVLDVVKPSSAIDFGCGVGTWLEALNEIQPSTKKLVGLDGDWGDKKDKISNNIEFKATDFTQPFHIDNKYDLAMSLEVAEHLPHEKASLFVESICSASDVVLFGAAIKGQGGVDHVNEQYQSYWYKKFKKYGFECYDLIRANFFNNNEVGVAYRQNTFVYVNKNSEIFEKFHKFEAINEKMLDIVHPIVYERKDEKLKSNKFLLKQIVKNILKHGG
jgi:hypothetical protein